MDACAGYLLSIYGLFSRSLALSNRLSFETFKLKVWKASSLRARDKQPNLNAGWESAQLRRLRSGTPDRAAVRRRASRRMESRVAYGIHCERTEQGSKTSNKIADDTADWMQTNDETRNCTVS